MQSFPLIRTKWSNERVMAALTAVLALYEIPRLIAMPGDIPGFIAVISTGLVLDTIINFIRFRRLTCAVSASVTALILYALTPGVPVWGELAALAIALIAGKHIWGGTGRNPVNPAMVGLLFAGFLFQTRFPVFEPSLVLLPALLLSLPFLLFRPFAAAGMAAGLTAALLAGRSFSLAGFIGCGFMIWVCLVITDPVTITAKPLFGAAAGLIAGLFPLVAGFSPASLAAGVLTANLLSRLANWAIREPGLRFRLSFRRKSMSFDPDSTELIDLTDCCQAAGSDGSEFAPSVILERIESCKIYGFGGAAFPTARKIRAVMDACVQEKHLIVNGAECDPGLIHDKWLLRHRAAAIQDGIALLARCIPFISVTIAVKDPSGLAFNEPARLFRVKDLYPAGEEKSLIRTILSKPLGDGVIPAEKGILVLNAQTVLAIHEAVRLNRPADTRYITFASMDSSCACVARIRTGTRIQDLADEIRRNCINPMLKADSACLYVGGGAMNAQLASPETAADESVNLIATAKYPRFKESPLCSQCGLCSAVCPAGLDVSRIGQFLYEERADLAAPLHPEKCIRCGACSVVCLAGRNLSGQIARSRK